MNTTREEKFEIALASSYGATTTIDGGVHPHGNAFEGTLNPFKVNNHQHGETAEEAATSVADGAANEDDDHSIASSVDDIKGKSAQKKKAVPPSTLNTGIKYLKYFCSMCLLMFSIFLVMAAIFMKQTTVTSEGLHPAIACVVFWFLIVWLGTMEGGQGCLVGLQPIDKSIYADSHHRTFQNTTITHKGDNMDRFIVGRQFLVVLVVFLSNLMASSIQDATVFNLPKLVNGIFLSSGVALILITVTLGQLTAQVNAADCMLDFVNNFFMLYFVTYVSLVIEFSGLLHSVYLVQIVFSKFTGTAIVSKEKPRNASQQAFFWVRVVFSCVILGYAFAVTLSAIFSGHTTMWDGVPPVVSVVIFFILMCFAGLMDGMQIALFAVVNMPEEELEHYPTAHCNCELTFSGENLQAFLIGRQICVTICTFVIARIATLDINVGVDDNIFAVSDGIQTFFNTGLLGAIITTVIASLAWRIVASSFPVAFLSNPIIYWVIRLCLLLEASGLCSAAWLLASVHKQIAGFQPDSVYGGKAGDRPTGDKGNDLFLQEEGAAGPKP